VADVGPQCLKLVEGKTNGFRYAPGNCRHENAPFICFVIPYQWHHASNDKKSGSNLLEYLQNVVSSQAKYAKHDVETLAVLRNLKAFLPAGWCPALGVAKKQVKSHCPGGGLK
jgi:hypothetical protein